MNKWEELKRQLQKDAETCKRFIEVDPVEFGCLRDAYNYVLSLMEVFEDKENKEIRK